MFGDRREPVASNSDGGSASEAEEDDGGRNFPMDEAIEVPDPEAGEGM